jgi:hypothetical protein
VFVFDDFLPGMKGRGKGGGREGRYICACILSKSAFISGPAREISRMEPSIMVRTCCACLSHNMRWRDSPHFLSQPPGKQQICVLHLEKKVGGLDEEHEWNERWYGERKGGIYFAQREVIVSRREEGEEV